MDKIKELSKMASSINEEESLKLREIRYDEEAKNFFSNKKVLSFILRNVIKEFKGLTDEELIPRIGDVSRNSVVTDLNYIESLPTEDSSIKEKLLRYDIKTVITTDDKEDILCYLNIEMQQKDNPDDYIIEERASYYCSRLLSSQLGKSKGKLNYSNLRKVYSIWIIANSKEESAYRFVRYKEDLFNGSLSYSKEADLEEFIIIRLNKNEFPNEDILNFLHNILFCKENRLTKEKLNEYISIDIDIEQGVDSMCNLSKGIFEEGLEEGREEGREEGKEEGKNELLLKLVKSNLEDGIDDKTIIKFLKLKEDEYFNLKDKILNGDY